MSWEPSITLTSSSLKHTTEKATSSPSKNTDNTTWLREILCWLCLHALLSLFFSGCSTISGDTHNLSTKLKSARASNCKPQGITNLIDRLNMILSVQRLRSRVRPNRNLGLLGKSVASKPNVYVPQLILFRIEIAWLRLLFILAFTVVSPKFHSDPSHNSLIIFLSVNSESFD